MRNKLPFLFYRRRKKTEGATSKVVVATGEETVEEIFLRCYDQMLLDKKKNMADLMRAVDR